MVFSYRLAIGETMASKKTEVLQGTLQLMILKTLSLEPMHGLGIVRRIEQITRGSFRVSLGALFPALHRMEEEGVIAAEWGPSENNRNAKYYRLTAAGRRRLKDEQKNWLQVSSAITALLEAN
jgi:PadR family transcriptional regulator